jgi:hypothetical protein
MKGQSRKEVGELEWQERGRTRGMYVGSIEDDIKQPRVIQRACRRFGLEYAEFQQGDSDGFFPECRYRQPANWEKRSHPSCESCPSHCQNRPHCTCHYSRRINCPAKSSSSRRNRRLLSLPSELQITEQRHAGWTADRGALLLETWARKQPDPRSLSKPLTAASAGSICGST